MQRLESGYSRYEQIALDIAQRIARGEFQEGQKLSGRSLLAGTYNVSPETIRRSIALLQNIGVVEAITGSGIVIRSASLAKEYLIEYNERQEIINLRNRINNTLNQRRQLDLELEKELSKLLEYAFQKASFLQQIEEIIVSGGSFMVGKTIAETKMRYRTGATIIAIIRAGREYFSPAPDFVMEENDILLIVGNSNAKERVKELILGESED